MGLSLKQMRVLYLFMGIAHGGKGMAFEAVECVEDGSVWTGALISGIFPHQFDIKGHSLFQGWAEKEQKAMHPCHVFIFLAEVS